MLAAFCHASLNGASLEDAAAYGHRAAALTVASPYTVRPDLRARMVP
jgi:pseudouridine kinase